MGIANSSMVKATLGSFTTENTKNKSNRDDGIRQQQWMLGEDAFNAKAVHHQGIKELWEAKWKFPVSSACRCCLLFIACLRILSSVLSPFQIMQFPLPVPVEHPSDSHSQFIEIRFHLSYKARDIPSQLSCHGKTKENTEIADQQATVHERRLPIP